MVGPVDRDVGIRAKLPSSPARGESDPRGKKSSRQELRAKRKIRLAGNGAGCKKESERRRVKASMLGNFSQGFIAFSYIASTAGGRTSEHYGQQNSSARAPLFVFCNLFDKHRRKGIACGPR